MVGGIRRRSYSNEKMDTKAKGAIAPDSSKSALLLNQHPFFIAVVALLVSSPAWFNALVRLSFWLVSFFFPSPTVYSPLASFSSLLLSYTASLRLPGEAKDEYSIMNERQNFR